MQKRNVFLVRINSFTLKNLRRTDRSSFTQSKGLNGAIRQQNQNAINDGITLSASLAPYRSGLKLQGLAADRADDPAQILCCQRLCVHGSILANPSANP